MNDIKTAKSIRLETLHAGAILRVTLDSPKGNVLDQALIHELRDAFDKAAENAHVKTILLCAAGENFCFGASVEEHLPAKVEGMLHGFHELLRGMASSGIPVLVAVRGLCLGGGLELAAFCHRIFVHPAVSLGQPEVKLGVFAPIGSVILAERIGRGPADDLLLTGHSVGAAAAYELGLVDVVADDPEAAALAWAEEYLLPLSASSLRFATRASRLAFKWRFEEFLNELEKMYLEELMHTHDAVEGITAFLEKRVPVWRDR